MDHNGSRGSWHIVIASNMVVLNETKEVHFDLQKRLSISPERFQPSFIFNLQ